MSAPGATAQIPSAGSCPSRQPASGTLNGSPLWWLLSLQPRHDRVRLLELRHPARIAGYQAVRHPGRNWKGPASRCGDATEARPSPNAKHLGVGRSTLYRTLAAYDEAAVTRSEARS